MSAPNQYVLDRVELNTAAATIKGCTAYTINPNLTTTAMAGGSELDPSTAVTTAGSPEASIQTLDAATLLPIFFDGTKLVPHLAIASATDLWFGQTTDGGTRASTGIKARCTKGLLVPVSLVDSGGLAELTCALYMDSSDGTTSPLAYTTGATLTSGAAGSPSLWTMRSVVNNVTVLKGLRGIKINFNVKVQRFIPENSIYPINTTVTGYAPTVEFGSTDAAVALAASGFSGVASGAAGLKCYLGKYDPASAGLYSTSVHMALILKAASPFWPTSISFGNEAPVIVNYSAAGKGGDTVAVGDAPMSLSSSLALPSESSSAVFMSGPFVDNATVYEVKSASVDFGLSYVVRGPETLLWPNHCTIIRREPTFTLVPDSAEFVSGLGAGRAVNTSAAMFLRAVTANSEPVASATASHIKMSGTAGWIKPTSFGAQHAAIAEPGCMVQLTGGLTIATGQAIA